MKDWPAFSLDLNPIENVWKIIKKNRTWKEGFGEKNELIEAASETYNQISENTIFHLVESFQRRMIKCIKNNVDRVLH